MYLVGAGPGDPELVTVRGRRLLAEADMVLYDALVHPELLAYARPEAERVFVGKRGGRRSERQAAINERLVEGARAGKRIVRLKGGDPYLFGRGSEEAEHLTEHGVSFEVIPGIPSPLAATSYAGISLTHRSLASSVAYVTATESVEKDRTSHDWSRLATATQTLVIFMGMRKLGSLMELLIEHGRAAETPVAVVQWASLPKQRTVVGTVADIAERVQEAGIGAPALTIVGEVVRLRESLRWFDTAPLFGRRVLVTRTGQQAGALSRQLREAGAWPVEAEAIRIVPADDAAALTGATESAASYDWVVFTSQNAVRYFFEALRESGGDARRLGEAKVCAVGPQTAAALEGHGIRADLMPPSYRGDAAAAALLEVMERPRETRLLLPRAEIAKDVLPDALRAAGATVDIVTAYRTLPPLPEGRARLRTLIEEGELDVITFTSSSSVRNLVDALGADALPLLSRLQLAAIGPVTAKTAEELGLEVAIAASEYTTRGLVAALAKHFRTRQ